MRKLRGVVLTLAAVCLLTGCGGSGSNEDQGQNAPGGSYVAQPDASSSSIEEEYYPYIDMQWVLSNITVNDVAISFPTKAVSFGEGMSCGNMEIFQRNGRELYRGKISNDVAQMDVETYLAGTNIADMMIYELTARDTDGINLRVVGITFGDSYEQIVAACGEPTGINESDSGEQYVYYENSVNEFLGFELTENRVSGIVLHYYPEEFR